MALSLFFPLVSQRCPGLRRTLVNLSLVSAVGAAGLAGGAAQAQTAEANTAAALAGAGGKGAQIYCFMRNSDNNHQVSWDAAYAVIKRQNDKLSLTWFVVAEGMVNNAITFC